jgi:hypothetical protein
VSTSAPDGVNKGNIAWHPFNTSAELVIKTKSIPKVFMIKGHQDQRGMPPSDIKTNVNGSQIDENEISKGKQALTKKKRQQKQATLQNSIIVVVWLISPEGPDSIQIKRLGRYTGPVDTVEDALCAMVCDERLIKFHRTSVFLLSQEDKLNPKVQKKIRAFNKAMAATLDKRYSYKNTKWKLNKNYIPEETNTLIYYNKEEVTSKMFQQLSIDSDDSSTSSTSPLPDAEDIDMGYNNYVSVKILIPVNGYQFANGVVKRWARDANEELIGKINPNSLLDTLVYKVELEDGSIKRYHANILAEHIYNKLDNKVYSTSTFDSIVDHKLSGQPLRGQKVSQTTTKGWTMCVQLNNGSTMWVPLSELKDAQPA